MLISRSKKSQICGSKADATALPPTTTTAGEWWCVVRRGGVGLGDARDALLVLGLVGLANMLLLARGSRSNVKKK